MSSQPHHSSIRHWPPRLHPYTRNPRPGYSPGGPSKEHNDRGIVQQPKYSDRFKSRGYPPELNRLMGPLDCKLCAVEATSSIMAKMHYSGKNHMKKVKRFMEDYCERNGLPKPEPEASTSTNNSSSASPFPDYCQVCDVTLITINDKVLHFSGKNHRKNELNPQNAKKKQNSMTNIDVSGRFGIGIDFTSAPSIEGSPKEEQSTNHLFICELCDVKAVSQDQLEVHLAGKKHKERLLKQQNIVDDATPIEDKAYECDICGVALSTKYLYNLHLQGKRHSKSLSKLEMCAASCEICDVTYTSIEHRDQHLAGKKHEKMVMSNRRDDTISIACKFCPFIGNVDNHDCDQSLLTKFKEVGDLENKWACCLCNMHFENSKELDEHKKTRRHILISLNKNGNQVTDEIKHWYCIVCRTQYRNHHDFTEHLFQERHMTLSAEQQFLVDNTDLFHCLACNLFLDTKIKEEHEKDRKHLENALRKDTHESLKSMANEELNTHNFFCKNCNETLYGFVNYSEHVLSDTHIKTLIQIRLSQLE